MLQSFKKMGAMVCGALVIGFIIFSINQVAMLHANLLTINETLAWLVTGGIATVLLLLILVPVVLILRLPKAIIFPDDNNNEEAYIASLKRRLKRNKLVKSSAIDLSSDQGLAEALDLLKSTSDEIIKKTAKSVFLTTAISQNGKLDALTVFITQSKMIWEVAHVYWQRPFLKDMLYLYGNVAATSLIASELDEVDITRQIDPVINAVIKSPGRSIPVIGHAAHIITDSLLEGSTNAFLTLRIGIVTQNYCGAQQKETQKSIRKNSFITASTLLKALVLESSGQVVNSVVTAVKSASKNTIKSAGKGVSGLFKRKKNIDKQQE